MFHDKCDISCYLSCCKSNLKSKVSKMKKKKENSCKNCANAKGYTGFSDHYCKAYYCGIRAEQYDCSQFIDEDEDDGDTE